MDEDGFTLRDRTVCVVGLGLMGGSLALALRDRVAALTGVDVDPVTRAAALERGIVSRAADDLTLAREADVVVLATPVRTIIRLVGELGPALRPGALLFDIGSVKGPVVEAMNALPEAVGAVGGHPMCGKAEAGLRHAEAALYEGAPFVLCRTERSTEVALSIAGAIVNAVGARMIVMDAGWHDRAVAFISHLPYALSAALALTAGAYAATDPLAWSLAASGFRDTSRLAGSDPLMMADILLTNADAVLETLDAARGSLEELSALIRRGDPEALIAYLERVQQIRHDWERQRS